MLPRSGIVGLKSWGGSDGQKVAIFGPDSGKFQTDEKGVLKISMLP